MSYSDHPSGTERKTLKIRDVATGRVLERQPPDAREMVQSGAYAYASSDEPSIVEQLHALSIVELQDLCRSAGNVNVHLAEPKDACIAFLLPLVEAGTVTLG